MKGDGVDSEAWEREDGNEGWKGGSGVGKR